MAIMEFTAVSACLRRRPRGQSDPRERNLRGPPGTSCGVAFGSSTGTRANRVSRWGGIGEDQGHLFTRPASHSLERVAPGMSRSTTQSNSRATATLKPGRWGSAVSSWPGVEELRPPPGPRRGAEAAVEPLIEAGHASHRPAVKADCVGSFPVPQLPRSATVPCRHRATPGIPRRSWGPRPWPWLDPHQKEFRMPSRILHESRGPGNPASRP